MIKDVDYIIGFDFGHGETSVSMVDVGGLDCKAANIETKDLYIIGDDTTLFYAQKQLSAIL